MKQKQHSAALFVEVVLLVVVLLIVMLVLIRFFGMSRRESTESRELTNAVTLAQSAAEMVSASDSKEELLQLMNREGSAALSGEGITARYGADLFPKAEGEYEVIVSWQPEEEGGLSLVHSRIEVQKSGKSLYTLSTAVYAAPEAERSGT